VATHGELLSLETKGGIRYNQNLTKHINQSNEKKKKRGRPRTYHKNRPATSAERFAAFCQRKKRLIHFKSQSTVWATAQETFDALHAEFGFTRDVCATESNAKCPAYFTEAQDGLRQRREGICWMNPPYGQDISRWVQKAYKSSLWGTIVVCLLPARTDTRWWQNYVLPSAEIRYLPGRQRFSDSPKNAPFPSAVVIFKPAE
jgi:phage N-6-adenine-methyltransferase